MRVSLIDNLGVNKVKVLNGKKSVSIGSIYRCVVCVVGSGSKYKKGSVLSVLITGLSFNKKDRVFSISVPSRILVNIDGDPVGSRVTGVASKFGLVNAKVESLCLDYV